MRVLAVLLLGAVATTVPAQTTAFANPVGQGCSGFPGFPATLTVNQAPVIGQQTIINPAGLYAADGILWVSAGAPAPPTPVLGCTTWLDLNSLAVLTPFITGTAGVGWILVNVPNDPVLLGAELTLQATMGGIALPPGAPPVITEALHVRIGDQL
ncbi:MAG: hypothetical protein CMJ83_15600 [Planctomycetes bacterium]|nr:hypothetical protein [Planctomycetota bacterium]